MLVLSCIPQAKMPVKNCRRYAVLIGFEWHFLQEFSGEVIHEQESCVEGFGPRTFEMVQLMTIGKFC